jgi:hypothetical protein
MLAEVASQSSDTAYAAQALRLRGNIFMRLGQLQQAIAEFEAAEIAYLASTSTDAGGYGSTLSMLELLYERTKSPSQVRRVLELQASFQPGVNEANAGQGAFARVNLALLHDQSDVIRRDLLTQTVSLYSTVPQAITATVHAAILLAEDSHADPVSSSAWLNQARSLAHSGDSTEFPVDASTREHLIALITAQTLKSEGASVSIDVVLDEYRRIASVVESGHGDAVAYEKLGKKLLQTLAFADQHDRVDTAWFASTQLSTDLSLSEPEQRQFTERAMMLKARISDPFPR